MALKKITIVSNNICYGPAPEPADEVEQRFTINEKGQLWFRGYAYAGGFNNYKVCRAQRVPIGVEKAKIILSLVEQYFQPDHECCYATDIGSWELIMTDMDGNTHKESGSLCSDCVRQVKMLAKGLQKG